MTSQSPCTNGRDNGRRSLQSTVADVAFNRPIRHEFSYRIPDEWNAPVQPGMRVMAPLGARHDVGIVVSTHDDQRQPRRLKMLSAVVDADPILPPDVLELTRWVAMYYQCAWGETLAAAIGGQATRTAEQYISLPSNTPARTASRNPAHIRLERAILELLAGSRPIPLKRLEDKLSSTPRTWRLTISRLAEVGMIEMSWVDRTPPVPKHAVFVRHRPECPTEHDSILDRLTDDDGNFKQPLSASLLASRLPGRTQTLKSLLARDALIWHPLPSDPATKLHISRHEVFAEPHVDQFNEEQRMAFNTVREQIEANRFAVSLLLGPTGSGKTAVYCAAIRHAWSLDRRVLFLVPEIGLASQLIGRLERSLGERVGVWHSRMSESERYWMAHLIARGRYRLVVGARSAVFAPIADLGLIIVDEEHADAYKQSDPAPRYHARDAAVIRARNSKAVCLLGSATPSLETFHNAEQGKYRLLRLSQRIGDRRMPAVRLVDLRNSRAFGDDRWITPELREALEVVLRAGRKAIVFLNRRGHSTMVACKHCGHTVRCLDCALTMTYHVDDRTMRCHMCGLSEAAYDRCPQCRSTEFLMRGVGTQKIESLLAGLDAPVRLARLDTDVATRRGAAADILTQFAAGTFNLLIGTQMITKGIDIADVGLIGVICPDQQMSMPDFRAEERTFQLLTQVAGRAGRGAQASDSSDVLIQTFYPDHDMIGLSATQDYDLFAGQELPRRRQLGYPPYARLILVTFCAADPSASLGAAEDLTRGWRDDGVRDFEQVLGPAPATIPRRARAFYHNVLIKSRDLGKSRDRLNNFEQTHGVRWRKRGVTIKVDVDPVDFR